jgi:hypothetical protein
MQNIVTLYVLSKVCIHFWNTLYTASILKSYHIRTYVMIVIANNVLEVKTNINLNIYIKNCNKLT